MVQLKEESATDGAAVSLVLIFTCLQPDAD